MRGLTATGSVITSSGLVLAATFATLGVLPLVFFATVGFSVAFGVLLDTLLVRSVLVPGLALLLGDAFWWPGRLRRPLPDPPLVPSARRETVEPDERAGMSTPPAASHALPGRAGARRSRAVRDPHRPAAAHERGEHAGPSPGCGVVRWPPPVLVVPSHRRQGPGAGRPAAAVRRLPGEAPRRRRRSGLDHRGASSAGLAAHTAAYVLVNLGIALQSGLDVTSGVVWGWGIGLNAHALSFVRTPARRCSRLATLRARRW